MRLFFALFLAISAFYPCGKAFANDPLFAKEFPAAGSLKFDIREEIQSPIYCWPRTLLTYPVDFSQAKVKPEQLILRNGTTGALEPIQLSAMKMTAGGTLLFANVSFFSDLKPGAHQVFQLGSGNTAPASEALPSSTKAGVIEIDGGAIKVRLPASRPDISAGEVPPPILGLDAGSGWCGGGRLLSPVKPVKSLETTCTESGPLFAAYRLSYRFADGGSYEATIRIVSGYAFVTLTEKIEGLALGDRAVVEFDWSGLKPTKRMPHNGGWLCPAEGLGIDQPVTTPGSIEEPQWWPPNTVEDPAKEMLFRLAAFSGNGVREAVPAISFWEEVAGGRELGVFVPDAQRWNDRQYMVWQPTTLLHVRFRYADGHLVWSYPLVDGTRETGITLHPTQLGEQAIEAFRRSFAQAESGKKGGLVGFGGRQISDTMPMRYALWLRSWYGALSLDKVKNWVLTRSEGESPATVPTVDALPETRPKVESAAELKDWAYHSTLMNYPLGINVGIDAIEHRLIRPMTRKYLQYYSQFTPEDRRGVDALLLVSAYLNSDEDFAPSRICLSGTPNMSADGFCVPAELAVLFPKHPLFNEWADQFEKRLQLMGCYYTRPDVPAYGSLGGRWCESLSIYNWAYFHPTEPAQTSLLLADGKNRFANAWMAQRARWLSDELSAPIYNPNPMWHQASDSPKGAPPPSPWKPGMALTSQNGFERQYPAHGAHGSGTGIPVPDHVPILAQTLRRYDPLAAEHLFWATAQRPSGGYDRKGEYWEQLALKGTDKNNGTNPHLQSSKYTGHGIILRAGVDTPEELSIHLDQIDQGPNYRWGNNGEGSSGVLYFFAGGQPWSGHERENTGDHTRDATSGSTTFGVVKDGEFRSIGANVLEYPLYDLGCAQFGEITARKDLQPYSWPVYRSRSVMLVGSDYFILCDDAIGDSRFSWFTMKDLPYPKLVFLSPLAIRADHWSEVTTQISKGVLRDQERQEAPNVVLVTHKKNEVEMEKMTSKPIPYLEKADIKQYAWHLPKGEKPVAGVYWVKTPTSHDVVFRNIAPISFSSPDATFSGTAGVVRNMVDGSTELALFEGTEIGAHGVKLRIPPGSELGVCATFKGAGPISGLFMAPKATQITIEGQQISGASFYVDGEKKEATISSGSLVANLPAGRHSWELTGGQPTPMAPVIVRTENKSGGAAAVFLPVAGADHYRLETSADGGATWKTTGQGTSSPIELAGLANGSKIHVRVIAANATKESVPSKEYPVYVSEHPPEAPEGLDLILSKDRIDLSWGEILGASEYRLYRRPLGATDWTKIFSGPSCSFADTKAKGAQPPVEMPGRSDNALNNDRGIVYEYAVTAVNGNGEGKKGTVENSDPTGWRNWWPAGQERRFKRQTAYWLPPYVTPEAVPPLRYPQ